MATTPDDIDQQLRAEFARMPQEPGAPGGDAGGGSAAGVQTATGGEQGQDLGRTMLAGLQRAGGSLEALSRLQDLLDRIDTPNLGDELSEDELSTLGAKVAREYDIDKASRSEWESAREDYVDVAMQLVEEKSYPWPKAANIKYPLLAEAALQFNARSYPEIVQGSEVARAKVIGKDEDGEKRKRADRVESFQNYQLLHEMQDWSEGMDRLLLMLPIIGTMFKKTYQDSVLGHPVSDLIPGQHLVINYDAPSFDRAPRKTQEFWLYEHEIESRKRDGTFLDIELQLQVGEGGDEDVPHEFLEQHRREDIDDDGYAEPVIVVIHKDTSKVVRVVANFDAEGIDLDIDSSTVVKLDPVEYFTKYGFIPNPKSAVYDQGFGHLLNSLQGTIDTSLNQMLDAGHLQNANFWFYARGARMRSGERKLTPGTGIPVETVGQGIRDSIYMPQFPGPSDTLFNLLGLLIDAGKSITSMKDVLTGDVPANAQPTTVMALIEQGMKQFGAIYKRIHRSLGKELQKLYRLNGKHLPPEKYFRTLDENEPAQIMLADFSNDDFGIVPVSDPTVLSDQQRLAKAQYLSQFQGHPMLDPQEVLRRQLEAGNVDNIDELWAKQQPGPGPDEIKAQVAEREIALKEYMAPFERLKVYAEALDKLAEAEGEEEGRQMERYKQTLNLIQMELDELDRQRQREAEAAQARAQAQATGGGGASQ